MNPNPNPNPNPSPWGGAKIGSWAAEAELADAEILLSKTTATATATTTATSFPSLKDSISAKPKKKKLTLSEFHSSGSGPTRDEIIHLPTGPTARDPSEYDSRGSRGWGGGGSGRRGGFDGGRNKDYDSAPPPPPSRADEVDNWAATKRPVPERVPSSSSSSRYGELGGGSRADDVDNWSFSKKPVVGPTRSSNYGSGGSGGSDWKRGDEAVGRTRLVLEPRSGNVSGNVVTGNKASPFGAARPREEVLSEKGLDWKKLDSEMETRKGGGSRGSSEQGSRPTSSQSGRSESLEGKTRVKVNPFGEAKPREVLLEEKGLDWRKIDLQLENRRIDRPETEEEKAIKEEIENLRKDLENESGNDVSQGSAGDQTNLRGLIESKERDLEILTKELDDKVRFGQRPSERPGSGAGRPGSGAGRPSSGAGRPGSGAGRHMSFQERSSQPGPYDDYRGTETMDRPRSRGTGDIWTRPGEDRRGSFQGNRDRGSSGNRDFNRPTTRDRW